MRVQRERERRRDREIRAFKALANQTHLSFLQTLSLVYLSTLFFSQLKLVALSEILDSDDSDDDVKIVEDVEEKQDYETLETHVATTGSRFFVHRGILGTMRIPSPEQLKKKNYILFDEDFQWFDNYRDASKSLLETCTVMALFLYFEGHPSEKTVAVQFWRRFSAAFSPRHWLIFQLRLRQKRADAFLFEDYRCNKAICEDKLKFGFEAFLQDWSCKLENAVFQVKYRCFGSDASPEC